MIDVAVIRAGDVVTARFDDATDTWLIDGDRRAAVVVDHRRLSVPNLTGPSDFRGPAFHQTQWPPAFAPAGRRVAVIGPRAAHVTGALTRADVTLFDCPQTWETRNTKRRWLLRKAPARPRVVTSPVAEITATGIRTADGSEHVVDAIVYATGCSTKPGLPGDALVGADNVTVGHAWRDAATAYLGVAVHGFPNYFLLHGPDSPLAGDQSRYVDECLAEMARRGATRIEVRRSAQQQYVQRAHVTPPARAFDFTHHGARDVYDGPATLTVGADGHTVRARLTGHLDPIDGKYHWQGMVFGAEGLPKTPVTITTDALTAQARITEQTPWGSYSIVGVGAPPYELT
ncbi:MAG: DUF4873 domain-containing protein [Mycobacterium sp.]